MDSTSPQPELALTVNGQARNVAAGSTLDDLITAMGLDGRFLVVEYNGEPLARSAGYAFALSAGDRLELVRPVAGG